MILLMNNQLAFTDYHCIHYLFYYCSRLWLLDLPETKKNEHDAKAYFLAEGSLTWWAIGASLIASNISAEQFIGMSGEGFL